MIIYAGSLVNPQVLADAKPGAAIYNSAGMTLEEVLAVMKDAEEKGLKTVRVHTGDPAVFGAHREQMDALERMGIAYEVIPGVSSFPGDGGGAEKGIYPAGREPDGDPDPDGGAHPPCRRAKSLRIWRSTTPPMVIFLSVGMMDELAATLREEYRPETPVAVVYKATWEDQKIVRGTLLDIADKVREAGIRKTALTVVGRFPGRRIRAVEAL